MAASALWNPFPGTGEPGCFTAHKAHIHLREFRALFHVAWCLYLTGITLEDEIPYTIKYHNSSKKLPKDG